MQHSMKSNKKIEKGKKKKCKYCRVYVLIAQLKRHERRCPERTYRCKFCKKTIKKKKLKAHTEKCEERKKFQGNQNQTKVVSPVISATNNLPETKKISLTPQKRALPNDQFSPPPTAPKTKPPAGNWKPPGENLPQPTDTSQRQPNDTFGRSFPPPPRREERSFPPPPAPPRREQNPFPSRPPNYERGRGRPFDPNQNQRLNRPLRGRGRGNGRNLPSPRFQDQSQPFKQSNQWERPNFIHPGRMMQSRGRARGRGWAGSKPYPNRRVVGKTGK